MFYVYILKLRGKKTKYVGFTSNIEKRLDQHSMGKVISTRKLFESLIYFEYYDTKQEAMNREKWFKTGVGREWINNNISLVR